MRETRVPSLDWEDPLEKEMATHSSMVAWKIPWMEEPGGLQSTGLQRVKHDFTATPLVTPWTQHARLPCPSPSSGACSNSCPLSQRCHPTTSSSVVLFSSCLQSYPSSGSFLMSQLFPSVGQSIGASASASNLPMNIQNGFPLG